MRRREAWHGGWWRSSTFDSPLFGLTLNRRAELPGGVTDEERIFESACQELRKTVENQLDVYHELNRRAVDLAKIDLLVVSVVVTGLSLSSIEVSIPLLGGLLSLLYALWSCARIYEPRSFARGLAAESVDEIESRVDSGLDVEDHYRAVMYAYRRAITTFSNTHKEVSELFRDALWSSVAAITFFAIVVARQFFPEYPSSYDLLWLVVVPAVILWGKDKYDDERTIEHG